MDPKLLEFIQALIEADRNPVSPEMSARAARKGPRERVSSFGPKYNAAAYMQPRDSREAEAYNSFINKLEQVESRTGRQLSMPQRAALISRSFPMRESERLLQPRKRGQDIPFVPTIETGGRTRGLDRDPLAAEGGAANRFAQVPYGSKTPVDYQDLSKIAGVGAEPMKHPAAKGAWRGTALRLGRSTNLLPLLLSFLPLLLNREESA